MGDRLAIIDVGRKLVGAVLCPFPWGELGPHLTQCDVTCAKAYLRTKWYHDPSRRLATIDIGRKLGEGCCAPFRGGGAGSPSNDLTHCRLAVAEAYLHTKWHLDPSNRLATIHQRYRQTDRTDRTTVLLGRSWPQNRLYFLWSPYVIGQTIIFLPCSFFLLLPSIFFFFLA